MNLPTPTLLPKRIGQIAVDAHDLDRAVRFYRDVLEIEFLFQVSKAR